MQSLDTHHALFFSQDVNASKIFSEEAAQIYERAISGPLRKNQLLYFAYADFEESRLRYPEVHKIYQRYIEMEDIDPTLVSSFPFWINSCFYFFHVINVVLLFTFHPTLRFSKIYAHFFSFSMLLVWLSFVSCNYSWNSTSFLHLTVTFMVQVLLNDDV